MRKNNLWQLLTVVAVAMLSVMAAACSSDSDDGGSGSGTLTVQGKNYSLGYGFYVPGDENGDDSIVMFSSINLMSVGRGTDPSTRWSYFNIDLKGITKDNVPVGEFTNVGFEATINQTLDGKEEGLGFAGYCTVRVSKSGSTYTFDITTTNITDNEGGNVSSASLHYEGRVTDSSSIWAD
ncbi:MAG: hypothetical protein IJ637_08175 [Prevotella sp.]|nr:hypothetical protein [Prevotella sp.]